ncbi:MAG: hypothetical protein LBJ11_03010 [Oscillospiraceae bacterium]|jgi:hypothetical protein|nr:hypothetical protein [Oscillospiraceae bacterium]
MYQNNGCGVSQPVKAIVIQEHACKDSACKDPFENTPNALFLKLSDATIQGIITLIASIT